MHKVKRLTILFSLIVALVFSQMAYSQEEPEDAAKKLKYYFIHLSTGEAWLTGGNLKSELKSVKLDGGLKLRVRDSHTGNTDQREWPDRFDNYTDWKKYDIVMFKSCFPASHIDSAAMLKEYKKVYKRKLFKHFSENPDKMFIIITAPPLLPNDTDQACANRARTFNNWLKKTYIKFYNRKNPGLENVAVFDYFDCLADSNNMLKEEYRFNDWDSHPNYAGHKYSTSVFIPFFIDKVNTWLSLQ